MLSRISVIVMALATLAWAQAGGAVEEPGGEAAPAVETKADDQDSGATGETGARIVRKAGGTEEQVKVLKPRDVPAELMRLKSKADIKAEVTVKTAAGRPVVFKGVIRNGKLIERIIDRRFVPQKDIDHPHCGVRIWWSGGSDGYIFFRFENLENLALTGKLSEEERAEIMRRLRARREGQDQPKEAAAEEALKKLEEMNPVELRAHLLRTYPYDEGWDHKRMRALKRKEMIENKVLTREEAIFVKYFPILVEAHFEALKRNSKKIEIEPGTAESDKPEERPAQPAAPAGG